jgi:hypothetical protein
MTKPGLPTVRTDDLADLGPAMRALSTDKMRAFVTALVQTGCTPTRAAKLAGYGRRANGFPGRLTQDPRIQAALLEEGIKSFRIYGVAASHVVHEIMLDKSAKHSDRLKAAEMLLSRSGFSATTRHDVTVTHKSDDQLRQELLAMAEELGLDATAKQKLIGGPVVDAVFTEVPKPLVDLDEKYARIHQARLDRLEREAHPEDDTRRLRVREERRERSRREYAAAQAEPDPEPDDDMPTNPEPEGTEL